MMRDKVTDLGEGKYKHEFDLREPRDNVVDAIANLNRRLGQKCRHPRVFPIRDKFLRFKCLDCKKELEIRDVESLKMLEATFFQAGALLASRGITLMP